MEGYDWVGITGLTRTTDMNVLGGDSGSPLFHSPAAGDNSVAAIGIVTGAFITWAGTCSDGPNPGGPCKAWITPWDKIEAAVNMPWGGGLVPY